jgi:hypothetical protein
MGWINIQRILGLEATIIGRAAGAPDRVQRASSSGGVGHIMIGVGF